MRRSRREVARKSFICPYSWRRAWWRWARVTCSWRSGNGVGYGWPQLLQRCWLCVSMWENGGWPLFKVEICQQLSWSTGDVSPWVHQKYECLHDLTRPTQGSWICGSAQTRVWRLNNWQESFGENGSLGLASTQVFLPTDWGCPAL